VIGDVVNKSKNETITLRNSSDTYNFTRGETYVMTASGVRRVTGWFGLRYRARQFVHGMTRWWRPRTVYSVVDRKVGAVTMQRQTWSWRRWRWE
jgi:hypothetical protein